MEADRRSPGPDAEFEQRVLAPWRQQGRAQVTAHADELATLIAPLAPLIGATKYPEAAAALQLAADYAVLWHSGIFTCAALEAGMRAIGRAVLPVTALNRSARHPEERLKILHVASRVASIGGMSRMMWRWIAADSRSMHSVALTRQHERIPENLRHAVVQSGGHIHCVNRTVGGLLAWARMLQRPLAEADLIVLHVYNFDVIPFLALAGMQPRPKVVFVNHADHVFWIGASFIDLVVNTRRSGHRLCIERRCIPEDRNALLPLCVRGD